MKRFICIFMIIAMLAVFVMNTGAVGEHADSMQAYDDYASTLGYLRRLYRDSDAVVLAKLVSEEENTIGIYSYEFTVEFVYAGKVGHGESIFVEKLSDGSDFDFDQTYLLYLKTAEPLPRHSVYVGAKVFTLVGDAYFRIEDRAADLTDGKTAEPLSSDPVYIGTNFSAMEYDAYFRIKNRVIVLTDGRKMPLEYLERDIAEQKEMLSIPSHSFFYNEFEELVEACDSIVIGRVKSVDFYEGVTCRFGERGESAEIQRDVYRTQITVLNGLGFGYEYGDTIEMITLNDQIPNVIHADSLRPMRPNHCSTPGEGGIYIFFLNNSEDKKVDYCFPINPYQGAVRLYGDSIQEVSVNHVMSVFNSLEEFAIALNSALNR